MASWLATGLSRARRRPALDRRSQPAARSATCSCPGPAMLWAAASSTWCRKATRAASCGSTWSASACSACSPASASAWSAGTAARAWLMGYRAYARRALHPVRRVSPPAAPTGLPRAAHHLARHRRDLEGHAAVPCRPPRLRGRGPGAASTTSPSSRIAVARCAGRQPVADFPPHRLPLRPGRAIFTGARLAIGIVYGTLIAAEIIAGSSGIGWMILDAGRFLRSDYVFVGILDHRPDGRGTRPPAAAHRRTPYRPLGRQGLIHSLGRQGLKGITHELASDPLASLAPRHRRRARSAQRWSGPHHRRSTSPTFLGTSPFMICQVAKAGSTRPPRRPAPPR